MKAIGLLLLGAIAGWFAYSRVGIDHRVTLPKAVDATQKSFVSAEAGRISYYVDRQVAGRPLVLIHSINAAPSTLELKPLFEHYRAVRPVYALDLPGFGFSERSQRTYSPALYQAAIRDFLITEVGEPADLIALSLSSEFAASVALAHPARVNSLVLLSPTGLNTTPTRIAPETSQRIYKGVSNPLWGQALYDLLTTRRSIRYYLNKNFVGDAPDEMIDYAYATSHQPGASIAPFHFLSAQLFTWNIRPLVYEQLQTPTLVIYDNDPNVNFGALDELCRKNPTIRAARVSPSLGLAHWEMLAGTTAVIDEFWAN
jgi:pimeloyl-ACP methyl ester carboxylesterase